METFDQKGVQLGCMSCHNRARMTADFMWTVADHAYPPRLAPAAKSSGVSFAAHVALLEDLLRTALGDLREHRAAGC